MNSLEWRLKKLEDRILGRTAGPDDIDKLISSQTNEAKPILDQLSVFARLFKGCVDNEFNNYNRFVELYAKHRTNLEKSCKFADISLSDINSKAELVLAYEADLKKYLNNTKLMAEMADRVLDIKKWPDLTGYEDKLSKLQSITAEQYPQSVDLDKKTEKLIQIYNDIINSFKRNMVSWEETLESREKEADRIGDDSD